MLVSTVVLAIAAIWSVVVAKRAADSVKGSIRLNAILQALDEYSSVVMGGHIAKLYAAFRGNKGAETIGSFDYLWKTGDRSKVESDVDEARRSVAWYFTKIFILYKERILTENDIRENDLAKADIVEDILLSKVERLDKPDRRGKETYAFFRDLYAIK